jgi:large subunit ribosomal protein L28
MFNGGMGRAAMLDDVPGNARRGSQQSEGAGHVDCIQDQHRGQDNKRPGRDERERGPERLWGCGIPCKLKILRRGGNRACAHPADFGQLGRIATHSENMMAQVCDICGKGPQFGNKISHAHNVTKRRWNVNLHPVKAKVGGGNKRLRVCSSCLKAGKVVKA